MKDYLLNQLIINNNKESFTPDIDQYREHQFRVENRKSKRLTNKIFCEPRDRKLFLKTFAAFRGKLRHGNQFDVASKLSTFYSKAKNNGLFQVIEYDWYVDLNTAKLTRKHEGIEKTDLKIHERKIKRDEFLHEFGFVRPNYNYDFLFELSDIMIHYFVTSTPAAIVQMKKRLSRKNIPKKSR